MSGPVLTLVLIVVVGGAAGNEPPTPNIRVVAIQATNEGREPGKIHFDPGLGEVRAAVADLKFDTYRKIRAATLQAPYNKETEFQINPKYTLFVKPLSRERTGQVRLNIRIEMPPKDKKKKPIKAIETTVAAAPEKQFKLRGLKLDNGELVVVISVKN